MGITIHYRGHARSDEAVQTILDIAEDYARRKEWWRHRRDTESKLLRFDEEGDPVDYRGRVRGIVMIVEPGEEIVRLEFGDDLYTWWFTKTQTMRLESHIEIVELLRLIEPHMADFEVRDEGEYWETGDRQRLYEKRERNVAFLRHVVRTMRAEELGLDN